MNVIKDIVLHYILLFKDVRNLYSIFLGLKFDPLLILRFCMCLKKT